MKTKYFAPMKMCMRVGILSKRPNHKIYCNLTACGATYSDYALSADYAPAHLVEGRRWWGGGNRHPAECRCV